MLPTAILSLLVPSSAVPSEARPFLVVAMVVGVGWWIGHRLWLDIAGRPSERRPRLVNWYESRSRSSQSSIKMGWIVAVFGLGVLAMYGGTADTSPNNFLGLALFAIGVAQILYGSLILR